MAAPFENKSRFYKTVHLHEWWLIWAEDENRHKKLAIGGYTSRGQRALRVFSSSPILRRHDVFTLETTDGICLKIGGFINKIRTEKNGFPSEVFKCFFFGFPPHWEVCAEHYLAQGLASNDVSREDASLKGFSQTIIECNTTNAGANVGPISPDQKLDRDQAVCAIREGSQTSMYINETEGAKDPRLKNTADIEMETNLKENANIKEANKAEKKTHNNVSSEDASLEDCSDANALNNETNDAGATVSLANTGSEPDQHHTAYMILEGSKNSDEVVKCITRACGANDTDLKKTADLDQESNINGNVVIKEASTAEKKTYNNVPSEDASLKGCSKASEQTNEKNNSKANASLANTSLKMDEDPTAYLILEGSENSNESVRYITRACDAKDTDQRTTADIEMESSLKANTVIKEASIAEETSYNNVSTEDASLENCSYSSEQINEMTNTEPNISTSRPDLELNQDNTCMILEGSKNFTEDVRNITRARGEKDTDQKKTVAVEKESIMEENTASKEASTNGKKTCTDASKKFKESSKTSSEAVRCRTSFGGAKYTDGKRTATVKKGSTLREKAASKETSTPKKKTKRKLTYGSPVTPKADGIPSFKSPGLSSVKRSRSGRLLLPTLEFWRNQMVVYDQDHQVVGVTDGTSSPFRAELTHEPERSVGRIRTNNDPNAATKKLTREPKRTAGKPKSKKDPKAATEKLTHEPKGTVRRPRSKKDPIAATEKPTHEPKRPGRRPRSRKDPDAAKEEIKSSHRR